MTRKQGKMPKGQMVLAHQNRTIAIASGFRVDGAKSPEIPQREEVLGSEMAARNRKSLATFHRNLMNRNAALLSLVSEIAAISGVCDGHRNRKSQKSLRFRCAKGKTPKGPQGPCHTKNTMVIAIHYGGGQTLRR